MPSNFGTFPYYASLLALLLLTKEMTSYDIYIYISDYIIPVQCTLESSKDSVLRLHRKENDFLAV